MMGQNLSYIIIFNYQMKIWNLSKNVKVKSNKSIFFLVFSGMKDMQRILEANPKIREQVFIVTRLSQMSTWSISRYFLYQFGFTFITSLHFYFFGTIFGSKIKGKTLKCKICFEFCKYAVFLSNFLCHSHQLRNTNWNKWSNHQQNSRHP